MILAIGLIVGWAAGVEWRRLLVLALAVYAPFVVGGLVLMVWWRARSVGESSSALFCEAVASELRAGGSLRHALLAASSSVGYNELAEESSMGDMAAACSKAFPDIGEELRLTIKTSVRAGSDVATLFDEIGSLAVAKSEIRREVGMATAPGRMTALVLVGAPILYLSYRLALGGAGRLFETSQQRTAATIGFLLFMVGSAATTLVTWRATK